MKKDILLAEDTLADVVLTLRALGDCEIEHQIVTAFDGEEARRLTAEKTFDLLLLDIKMPRLDGLELLEKLGERPTRIPTIVLSGSDLSTDRERAHALGAIEYVHKAMEYHAFKDNLKAALHRHGFC